MHSFLSDITVLPVFVLKTVLQPITLFGRRIKAQEKMSRENLKVINKMHGQKSLNLHQKYFWTDFESGKKGISHHLY